MLITANASHFSVFLAYCAFFLSIRVESAHDHSQCDASQDVTKQRGSEVTDYDWQPKHKTEMFPSLLNSCFFLC